MKQIPTCESVKPQDFNFTERKGVKKDMLYIPTQQARKASNASLFLTMLIILTSCLSSKLQCSIYSLEGSNSLDAIKLA